MEAIKKYDITRLALYIHSLRDEGLKIKAERIEKNGKWFFKYYM